MNRRDDSLFAGLERPRAPGALRERALAAAREAMSAPPLTIWVRIWESPVARLALAASLAALIAGHVWISLGDGGTEAKLRYARLGSAGAEPGLGEVVALPRISITPTPFD